MIHEEDFVRQICPSTVELKRKLPAAPARVWEYLVDPDLRQLWFCGGETGCQPGDPFVMAFDHSKLSESAPPEGMSCAEQMELSGEITIFRPPHELAYVWPDAECGPGTLVTIRLEAVEEQTLLSLTHERLNNTNFLQGASAGWHTHFDLLADLMNQIATRNFWERYAQLSRLYQQRYQAAQ